MQTELLTFQQLKKRLKHVPATWLKAEVDAGRLPCLNVGARRVFNPDAVIDELARRASQIPETSDARAELAPA